MSEHTKKDDGLGYYFDRDAGEVHKLPIDQADQLFQLGYVVASPEQVEDYEKVRKFSTAGHKAATFGEGFAQSLTLGASTWAEKALGVDPAGIASREEVNPGYHLAGSLTGVAVPLVLSGGASGLLGAAKSAVGTASKYSAPSLIAHAGEAAAEGVEHLIPHAWQSSGLGRIGAKAIQGAASAGAEGALYGAGHVVHEAALGDPNLTAISAIEEVGLSALLGGGVGAAGGILSGLTRETLGGVVGKKLEEWATTFEGNQNIKSAAGPGKGQAAIKWLTKRYGIEGANKLGQEAGELGLVSKFSSPAETFQRAGEMLDEVGPKIGDFTKAADAAPDVIHPKAADVIEKMRTQVLEPLQGSSTKEGVALAKSVEDDIARFEEKLAQAGKDAKVSFEQLHEERKLISKDIYGVNGDLTVSSARKQALSDLRNLFSDEISTGLEKSGLDSAEWKALNRQYTVASAIEHIAEKGMAGAGLSGIPLSAIITGVGGLVHGGPLGAAALGLGTMAAKRYGPGLLAAGARTVRQMVDEGAAESLVNKTANLIAHERQAASGAAAESAASAASGLAHVFDKVAEHAEPLVAPAKDATRHVLHENVEEKLAEREAHHGRIESGASSEPERFAALSHLEAANHRVEKHTSELAHAFVTGKDVAHGAAGVISAKTVDEFQHQMEQVRALANNPQGATEHLTQKTSDVYEHAPDVAQAVALNATRAMIHLHQKFPALPKIAPLAPKMVPSQHDLFRYNKTREALEKPTSILKHAAAGTLTPMQVEAVRAAYPERLQQMQTAVLEKLAEHDGQMPYRQRLMLPILFGRDMDGTMSPHAIQANQIVYSMPSQKSGQDSTGPGAVHTSQTGLGKLKLSTQSLTPGQASDTRRRSLD